MNLFLRSSLRRPWNTSSIPAVIGCHCEEKSSIQNCKALQSERFFLKAIQKATARLMPAVAFYAVLGKKIRFGAYKSLCESALRQHFHKNQYSFAPAGIWGSTISRCSFSSPSSLWTADSSIPQDSMPIIGLGGRLVMAIRVLPISCSGS